MIYIFCGEDTGKSRTAFANFKKNTREKTHEVIELSKSSLKEIPQWLYESQSLFASEKVFFTENILSKKENRESIKLFDTKEGPHIAVWEEALTDRETKRYFKNAFISNFKLPETIFTLLDSIFPSNKKNALTKLQLLKETVEENMLLFMLARHIRDLIMVKKGYADPKKQAWQIDKTKTQAQRWNEDKLVSLYQALFRIEESAKTGNSYYSIFKSLDILFCYYL